MEHRPRKKPSDFGGNPDHDRVKVRVRVRVTVRWGHRHSPRERMCYWRLFNSNNVATSASLARKYALYWVSFWFVMKLKKTQFIKLEEIFPVFCSYPVNFCLKYPEIWREGAHATSFQTPPTRRPAVQSLIPSCDDGDLLLCTVWCGLRGTLHFYVFTIVHGDQSVVAFAPSFLWPRESHCLVT